MPKVKMYNMAGEQVGEVELSEAIFGITPNVPVMHAAVKNHLANKRQGTQSTLTRAEVSGGGKKPWRQKGTGRARAGSTRAPHWVHGGVAFAPKPRDYSYSLNRKVKRLALKSALSAKALEDGIIVIDDFKMDEIKTRDMKSFLDKIDVNGKAMLVTEDKDENIYKSARNIPGIQTTSALILNTYDIINSKKFVVSQAALKKIEEVFA